MASKSCPAKTWGFLKTFLVYLLVETKKFFLSITIEPITFLNALGGGIAGGAQQVVNLQIKKICEQEFEFNQTICDNLNSGLYDEEQDAVQIRLNNFHLIGNYIQAPPPIVYTLFIGAISDRVGRKPLMLALETLGGPSFR